MSYGLGGVAMTCRYCGSVTDASGNRFNESRCFKCGSDFSTQHAQSVIEWARGLGAVSVEFGGVKVVWASPPRDTSAPPKLTPEQETIERDKLRYGSAG